MSDSLTQRNGTTDYRQETKANDIAAESALKKSVEKSVSQRTNDTTTTTTSSGTSGRANVGCQISFRIKVTGRYPLPGNNQSSC